MLRKWKNVKVYLTSSCPIFSFISYFHTYHLLNWRASNAKEKERDLIMILILPKLEGTRVLSTIKCLSFNFLVSRQVPNISGEIPHHKYVWLSCRTIHAPQGTNAQNAETHMHYIWVWKKSMIGPGCHEMSHPDTNTVHTQDRHRLDHMLLRHKSITTHIRAHEKETEK